MELRVFKPRFSEKEKRLVISNTICHLSTIRFDNGWPHCVPVSYMFAKGRFYVPSSSKSRKIRNIRNCAKVTIEIDEEKTETGLMLECQAKILKEKNAKPFKIQMSKEKTPA